MVLTDTHTHLYLEQFKDDIEQVIDNALAAGVKRFFLPNIDSSTVLSMMGLVEAYPGKCFPMMGLHPSSVKENFKDELDLLEKWYSQGKYCAVGEIGIDLYWDNTFFVQQETAFRRQIELAKELRLPIVIHVRNSFDEVFRVLDEINDEKLSGIFHCFSGTMEQAEKVIGYGGFKLGIGGVVTFKNAGLDKVVKQTDLRHIVLETDSPYLAPVPHRGKRNESAHLLIVAQAIAALKSISVKEVAEITTYNSEEVFGI